MLCALLTAVKWFPWVNILKVQYVQATALFSQKILDINLT